MIELFGMNGMNIIAHMRTVFWASTASLSALLPPLLPTSPMDTTSIQANPRVHNQCTINRASSCESTAYFCWNSSSVISVSA